MGLLLILPLLISGYLVCIKDRALYARLHRYEGQLLYLVVAWQGIVCFSVAFLLLVTTSFLLKAGWSGSCFPSFGRICPPSFRFDLIAWIESLFTALDPALAGKSKLWAYVTTSGILTLVVPFLLGPLRFWRFRSLYGFKSDAESAEIFAIVKSVEHLPMLKALASSMSEGEPVMITMADRKVYVGIVGSIGAPTEVNGAAEHFGLWVQTSGYRDKDTLKVVYTYDYPVFDVEKSSPIMFKQENVVSVTPYVEAIGDSVTAREESLISPILASEASRDRFRFGIFGGWIKRR